MTNSNGVTPPLTRPRVKFGDGRREPAASVETWRWNAASVGTPGVLRAAGEGEARGAATADAGKTMRVGERPWVSRRS